MTLYGRVRRVLVIAPSDCRQKLSPVAVALVTFADPGGKLAGVVFATPRTLVRDATPRCRLWTTAFVTHLGCQSTNTVLV
jgi:hypothetical protein